jgi:hypothetical protein
MVDNDICFRQILCFWMNTVVSHTQNTRLAALTPLVLSSITMQLFWCNRKTCCVFKIGCGFDCGKSSPLILWKNNCVLVKHTLNRNFGCRRSQNQFRFVILMRSTPSSNSKSALLSKASLKMFRFLCIKSSTSCSIKQLF